jgi:hypothetical protein
VYAFIGEIYEMHDEPARALQWFTAGTTPRHARDRVRPYAIALGGHSLQAQRHVALPSRLVEQIGIATHGRKHERAQSRQLRASAGTARRTSTAQSFWTGA